MAKVVWNSSSGFSIRLLNVSNLNYGTPVGTQTSYSVTYSSGERDVFGGSGFTYDAKGVPTGGVVTSYTGFMGSNPVGWIENVSIAVPALVQAASTTSTDDDFAIFKTALSGADVIIGNRGSDVLEGFGGNDRITGGLKGDLLYGGAGADRFIFTSVKDSRTTKSGLDLIYDFSLKQNDRLDLMAIDANSKKSGNQPFSFIGKSDFHKKAGELRYEKDSGYTVVEGDVNGDGKADFSVLLKGGLNLTKGYFYL
jgi:Ca2+-binding RTX toxin-like protein